LNRKGLADLPQKWVLDVVDAWFGKEVIVLAIDKATNVARWYRNFRIEEALLNERKIERFDSC